MTDNIGQTLLLSLNNGIAIVVAFLPKFIAGAIILLVGIIIASVLKQLVVGILKAIKIETFLRRYGVPEGGEDFKWSNILAEIVRWFVVILFLLPTADVWGLPRVAVVLNEILLYLPNVFVAAIITLVGFVFARLAHDVILASARGLSHDAANSVASVTRWAITIFVILAVLNQLGVASDLIKILFTGLVAMLAIAGGIAFGLGGQGRAKEILEGLQKRLK